MLWNTNDYDIPMDDLSRIAVKVHLENSGYAMWIDDQVLYAHLTWLAWFEQYFLPALCVSFAVIIVGLWLQETKLFTTAK
jgi:hypothetical protein